MRFVHPSPSSDAKGLWALLWRMFVFGPMIAIFGTLLLIVVLALTFVLPTYAVIFGIGGEYGRALLCVAAWLLWLKFGGHVRRFAFEGFEHGSL